MSQPFVGQLLAVGFNFAPSGWNFCNGQLLSISEFSTVFQLIGTTYGGDGQSTFAVPDLRSRIPVHQGTYQGTPYVMGQQSGVESVTISASQYPAHTHNFVANTSGTGVNTPGTNTVGGNVKMFRNQAPATLMSSAMIGSSGGGNQPHSNLQPYLCLNWVISLFGVFPSQS
jgi:microcystin-dependent protein